MSQPNRKSARGFTLLETTIALTVLLIASVGALSGLIAASRSISEGQLRQYETALAEAHAHANWFLSKSSLATTCSSGACNTVTVAPENVAVGTTPWKLDPTVPSAISPATTPPTYANPLEAGAFFTIDATGVITPLAKDASWTSCASAGIPVGTFCREYAVTSGVEDASTNLGAIPAGTTVFTLWTRVVRIGQPSAATYSVVHREVVFQ